MNAVHDTLMDIPADWADGTARQPLRLPWGKYMVRCLLLGTAWAIVGGGAIAPDALTRLQSAMETPTVAVMPLDR